MKNKVTNNIKVITIFVFASNFVSGSLLQEPPSPIHQLHMQSLLFPQFQNIAPCSCDLRPSRCELFCCCDPDCPKDHGFNSSCIQELYGGFGNEVAPKESCNRSEAVSDFQLVYGHPLICLERENSPNLGMFYHEFLIVHTTADYSALKLLSLDHRKGSAHHRGHHEDHYTFGSELNAVYKDGQFGNLNLPSDITGASANCEPMPIKFLQDRRSVCNYKLSRETCHSFTSLDLRLYLGSSLHPKIKSNYSSSTFIVVNVNYFATTEPYKYVSNIPERSIRQDSRISLEEDKDFVEVKNIVALKKRMEHSQASLKSRRSVVPLKLDDQRPILFNDKLKSCDDIVLEVEYYLFWKGSELIQVDADILLGNFTLNFDDGIRERRLTQKFSVNFRHASSLKSPKLTPTSGNPGYEFDRPLKSGKMLSSGFHEDSNLRIWRPNTDSLCRSANSEQIKFGRNSISGCRLRLSEKSFKKCRELQSEIFGLQNTLLSSGFVAKGGNPNVSNSDELLEIIYNEPTESNITLDSSRNVAHYCLVPSHMRVEILYTEAQTPGRKRHSIYRVAGVKITPILIKWFRICHRGFSCPKIQSFELITTVEFNKIPLIWTYQNASRFWVKDSETPCNGDICWNKLLYPFQQDLGHLRSYVVSWALLLVIMAVILIHNLRTEW